MALNEASDGAGSNSRTYTYPITLSPFCHMLCFYNKSTHTNLTPRLSITFTHIHSRQHSNFQTHSFHDSQLGYFQVVIFVLEKKIEGEEWGWVDEDEDDDDDEFL